jgi:peptidoglycan/xylan/chitin deacetylase (PgdA/CDA1 family)
VLADRGTLATFRWVGRAAEDQPLHVRAAVAAGHEIALHSWDHRPYNRMTPDEQRADMQRSLQTLRRISGMTPGGHKTASWRYDEATHRVAQELGLLWVMDEPAGDLPYLIQPDTALPPLVQFPPSRWFDDYTLFVDQSLPPRQAFELWRDDLDVLRDEGGMMCLTLHPFVSGRPGPSRTLAWLLDYAIDLGDVWIDRLIGWRPGVWPKRAILGEPSESIRLAARSRRRSVPSGRVPRHACDNRGGCANSLNLGD